MNLNTDRLMTILCFGIALVFLGAIVYSAFTVKECPPLASSYFTDQGLEEMIQELNEDLGMDLKVSDIIDLETPQ